MVKYAKKKYFRIQRTQFDNNCTLVHKLDITFKILCYFYPKCVNFVFFNFFQLLEKLIF
jgi:hypothetical protein